MPQFSIPRPSQIYLNCCFWFENTPSGNPVNENGIDNIKACSTFYHPIEASIFFLGQVATLKYDLKVIVMKIVK
jgi:hypothetical protein